MFRLYNTLTRKLEPFKPLHDKKVGMYSCGPTVYWNQHIGHMYAYVQWDVLVRYLEALGYRVKWVMNVTDVGHLTSDEDAGEDKMEKGARREGLTVWEIADKYTKQFLESLHLLGIRKPDVLCRATEHIKDQISLAQKIEMNGFAYKTKTGLVFDTGKFKDYSKFARLDLQKQEAGARVEIDPEKRHPWDFLLWVTNQPDHIMKWESPWGTGFPGWHIECTAMSVKYLGKKFDIHTGGMEHIPVHHTNEIAQGYGAFGEMTARFWLHNGHLLVDGEKMSKSLGNNILVKDLIKKGYDPLALRYLILNSHYRQGLDFTYRSLTAAQNALKSIYAQIGKLKKETETSLPDISPANKHLQAFLTEMEDDFNLPKGLAYFWKTVKEDLPPAEKLSLLYAMDAVLGLGLTNIKTETEEKIPEEIKKLVAQREDLRKKREFAASDNVRDQIITAGYSIEDTPRGPQVRKTS